MYAWAVFVHVWMHECVCISASESVVKSMRSLCLYVCVYICVYAFVCA